jgi:hypothetical protein
MGGPSQPELVMTSAYHSTRDLCERFRCSSRSIFRRMRRTRNPFPSPCIKQYGSSNLWDAEQVATWELKERERSHGPLSSMP